jgi:hypothetical protein
MVTAAMAAMAALVPWILALAYSLAGAVREEAQRMATAA